MSDFRKSRNVELSTLKYLKDSLTADWTGVTLIKGFPQKEKDRPPIVSCYLASKPTTKLEVGSRQLLDTFTMILDIYATGDGQRLDLADYLEEKLNGEWTYYTHSNSSGDNKVLDLVSVGKCRTIEFIDNSKIEFDEGVDFYDKFRHTIVFTVRKSTLAV